MAYNIRKNWASSFNLMVEKPIVILPFIFIAFFEGLALGLIYYFPRQPLADVTGPIIRRFLGEIFMHYPANLLLLPKLFYYAQVVIYVFLGVFLAAISANIVKNVRAELPLKSGELIKNGLKRYTSFFIFGLFLVVFVFFLRKGDLFIFTKLMNLLSKDLPQAVIKSSPLLLSLFLFFSNIILQTFLVLTIPLIVIKKKLLLVAMWQSIVLALRNFFSLFTLLLFPFLMYLPIALLKTDTLKLIDKTFPEINLYITIAGIILALFVECFVVICAAQFLLDQMRPKLSEQ